MKKKTTLLGVIFVISAAYAIFAGKRLGFWGAALFVFIWIAVFTWARSRYRS